MRCSTAVPRIPRRCRQAPRWTRREGGGSAASSASSGSGAAAGQAVTLNNTPLYVSSVAKNPATHKTGVYYFYDGILIRGRYRITNTPSRVGKTPVGQNVTGWADAADCGAVSTAKATPKKETSGQEDATLGAGTGTDIGLSIESLTYVDNAADDSDSIDLTLDAQDSKWLWGWMPQKGATLYPPPAGPRLGTARRRAGHRLRPFRSGRRELHGHADHLAARRREQTERQQFQRDRSEGDVEEHLHQAHRPDHRGALRPGLHL